MSQQNNTPLSGYPICEWIKKSDKEKLEIIESGDLTIGELFSFKEDFCDNFEIEIIPGRIDLAIAKLERLSNGVRLLTKRVLEDIRQNNPKVYPKDLSLYNESRYDGQND